MKKPNGDVIVMKKLTTRGLQALAGGPSKLRSIAPRAPGADATPSSHAPPASESAPPSDSAPPAVDAAPSADDALAAAEPAVAAPFLSPRDAAPSDLAEPVARAAISEVPFARPAAGIPAALDARPASSPSPLPPPLPPPLPTARAAGANPLALRTPPTLIHAEHEIPPDIREMALRALEQQRALAAQPANLGPRASYTPGGLVSPHPSSGHVTTAVTPVPPAPQPGAPAVVKGKPIPGRRSSAGWTAMLLALGVFIGLSAVAVVHGDARQAYGVVRQYTSQKKDAPVAAAPAAAAQPAPPAAEPPSPAVTPTVTPTEPAPIAAAAPVVVADDKQDTKQEERPAPKPAPKPEVTRPDPAPRPAKPANAYASTRVATAPAADPAEKPAPAAKKPAKPVKDDDAVAAAEKPEKPAKPAPPPAAKPADDDVAKISQMAQQQIGAALP